MKALIIVDVQNDFVEGGSLAVKGGKIVAAKIADYVYTHAVNYDTIVATRDWHGDPGTHFSSTPDYQDSWPAHCVANTPGAELVSKIKEVDGIFDGIFDKGMNAAAYSGFEGINRNLEIHLNDHLKEMGIESIDICGIATDYCVKATALDAVKLGYNVTLLLPLCAAVNGVTEAVALSDMKTSGVEIDYGSNEE